jgi:hypothetical protein
MHSAIVAQLAKSDLYQGSAFRRAVHPHGTRARFSGCRCFGEGRQLTLFVFAFPSVGIAEAKP